MTIITIALFAAAIFTFIWVGSAYISDCDPFPWFNKQKVILFTWNGSIYKSYVDKKGNSYVYPATKTCPLKLNEDGTVRGASFIASWEYA